MTKAKSKAKSKEKPEVTAEEKPEVAAEEKPANDGGKFYCPGCGRRYDEKAQACTGSNEAPHAPIEVVPTSELSKPGDQHTAAPNTDGT